MCKCNKYPNGQPQPVGLQQQNAIEGELKKLWRELEYLTEKMGREVEYLNEQVTELSAKLD